MNRTVLIGSLLGGLALIGIVGIGGTLWFDKQLDQSTKEYIENSISVRLGTNVECASADRQLTKITRDAIIVENCRIDNHPDFPSPYLANVSRIEIDAKQLTSQEYTEVNDLLLEGIDLNLDAKLPFSLNLQTVLSSNQNFGDSGEYLENQKSFFIKRMRIANLQTSITIPVVGKKTFQIDDIELTNLHNDNYKEEIRAAIQQRVNAEAASWLGKNAKVFSGFLIEAIVLLVDRILF